MDLGSRRSLLRFTSPCFPVPFGRRTRLALAAGVSTILLCGCGPKRVRADFRNYEAAYAQTSNRQMLLNLARLENHDPAYFFKLGQITSSYRMQGSVSASGQLTSSSGAVQIPTGGGTPGFIWENDPTFQFIPVNDDTNARLLLEPIQAETFDALYQQGWRIDQLFRLLVDRIEITRPQGFTPDGKPTNDCEVQTIRNLPPLNLTNPTPEQSDELSNYVTFLRVSALVYELQREGNLVLGGTETFKPYDKHSTLPVAPPPKDKNTGEDKGGSKDNGDSSGGGVLAAKDQEDAVDKSNLWKRTPQGWLLGRRVFTPVFYLTPMIPVTTTQDGRTVTTYVADQDQIKEEIEKNGQMTGLRAGTALANALKVLASGFSIETQESQQQIQEEVCPAASSASPAPTSSAAVTLSEAPGAPVQVKMSAKLILRSLMAVIAAAAQEGPAFEALEKSTLPIPPSRYDPPESGGGPLPNFSAAVPAIEQIPLLQLQWPDRSQLKDPLVGLTYSGKEYLISDPKEPSVLENQYWNRDMFRLINALTSQVTVDISKFPLPEILQLHSD
jgi:hypothetical protein